ncbi:MAG: hypothetical protein AABW81_03835 [Nanoarchaeota archaeon]
MIERFDRVFKGSHIISSKIVDNMLEDYLDEDKSFDKEADIN